MIVQRHPEVYANTIETNQLQYYRDEPALTDAGAADNFSGNRFSFKFK